MSRDPEADRYELQVERERHEELGQALYEKRRPDAPKAWAELDQAARTQWILIAIDQQGAVDTRRKDPELRPDATEQVDPELRAGLRALFGRMEEIADEADASERHCLLIADPQTSRRWVIGPFRSRLEARVAIPLIEARYRRSDPDFVFTYTPMIFEPPPWETA